HVEGEHARSIACRDPTTTGSAAGARVAARVPHIGVRVIGVAHARVGRGGVGRCVGQAHREIAAIGREVVLGGGAVDAQPVAVAAVITVIVIGAGASTSCREPPPPPAPPPPPPSPERNITQVLRYTAGYYRAVVEEDARRYGLPAPSPEELAAPLVDVVELD